MIYMFLPSIKVNRLIISRHIDTSIGKNESGLYWEKGLYKFKKTPLLLVMLHFFLLKTTRNAGVSILFDSIKKYIIMFFWKTSPLKLNLQALQLGVV